MGYPGGTKKIITIVLENRRKAEKREREDKSRVRVIQYEKGYHCWLSRPQRTQVWREQRKGHPQGLGECPAAGKGRKQISFRDHGKEQSPTST